MADKKKSAQYWLGSATIRTATIASRTTTIGASALESTANHGIGTPHTGGDRDSTEGAVALASTTFHAAITINDPDCFFFHDKDPVGTYFETSTATAASFAIQLQGDHIF